MSHKLSCSNVTSLLTSTDLSNHNIAADCQKWQEGLCGFEEILRQNDMLTPFLIPAEFDIDDPSKLCGPFTNLITDFKEISDAKALEWQQCIHHYAANVELESKNWAEILMMANMADELKTLVYDNLDEIDCVGGITMFKTMTNHMGSL